MRRLTANLRLFWDGALLSYIALFRWLRPTTYLASKMLMPLAQILFFVFLGMFATGTSNASFYIVGNAIQIAAINGIFGVTMSIGGDRWEGTLPYLFGTPANRMVMFVGRAFMHVIDGMLGVVLAFTWGVLVMHLDLTQTNLPALGLVILITTFSTSGLGLLLGCMSLMTVNVMFINNTMYFLLLFFSGANFAVDKLPAWLQPISWSLPLTRGILAGRALIAGGSLAEVAPLLAGEAALGVVYILLGYSLFRWFEYQAKSRGTLERM
jgi:ABC-2 type transport system permease protein